MKQIAAIPYENGQVVGHYGKTQAFLIATIEDGNIMNHDVVPTQGKGHGELAGFLKEHGVTVCLCGGMGEGAYQTLTTQGIAVIRGVSGSAEAVLESYAAGQIADDPEAVCTHHHDQGEGHSCSCGKHS